MEVVIFLLLKTTGKAFPLFKAQDLLAELSLPPLKWKKEPFPPELSWESAHINSWSWGPSPGSFQREPLLPSSLLFPRKVGIPILGMGCTKPRTFHWELGARNRKDPSGIAGPGLQRGLCTPEGKGKTQRELPASSVNREIPGFHLLQHKEFVPLQ